jgi:hypothetical protein
LRIPTGHFGTCLFDMSVSPIALMPQVLFQNKTAPDKQRRQLLKKRLFFLRNSQETVTWVFLNNAIFWQIGWFALGVLFYLCEKVDSLWFATTKGNIGLVQVVSNAL